jgi:dipeptidyl aminopeptidase/acylaminoacyl peptidase
MSSNPITPIKPTCQPFGEWQSPISAAMVAQGARSMSQPRIDGTDIYWLEGRASEGGRNTLLCRQANGTVVERTPLPFNVRTRVHEYGGGAYLVQDGMLVFSHFADNQLYVQQGEAPPRQLTMGHQCRYADFIRDPARARLISIREDHTASSLQPVNTLCAIALDGSAQETILAQGHDFYAAPRLSPDGTQLAWLSWDHPRMPWQGSELWLAAVAADGSLSTPRRIAGSATEAICQPTWSPDGVLHFVSDRSGWWNIYRCQAQDQVRCVHTAKAEFGAPHWVFGNAMLRFLSDEQILCTYIENGVSHLARLDIVSGALHPLATRYTEMHDVQVGPGFAVMLAGSPVTPSEIVRIDLETGAAEVLARSIASLPAPEFLSIPVSISYPSNGRTAHAFHYPPHNQHFTTTACAKPPLIVISHGGPTGMATSTLKLEVQYWTSRGFAVLDVNYGGSSGFGRAYRDALQGQWGVVDVEDCVNGARYLTDRSLVDGGRLIIRGGSAGGYTTLCALAFHDQFKAGASYYGVSDLKALDQDSHKFESHYNDYLIAPPPQCEALYRLRSPCNHISKLKRPMIFFQGLDDKVVPPPQSETMVEALRARGVPVAYLAFEGEGHGFRKAHNIQRSLEAELYFYGQVFDLTLTDAIEPVPIDNL